MTCISLYEIKIRSNPHIPFYCKILKKKQALRSNKFNVHTLELFHVKNVYSQINCCKHVIMGTYMREFSFIVESQFQNRIKYDR